MTFSTPTGQPVAIVTGASSGIGEATALRLITEGFTVYAGARRVDRMSSLADRGVLTMPLDLTDTASTSAFVDRVIAEQGRVDVVVNNAGYGAYGAFEEVEPDEARRQIEVNLFGLARLTQLVLPAMRAQGTGTIVNVSSIGGKITTPLGSWYHASKFAVEGLSDALRVELRGFGIRVVVIEPGAIATEWGGIARDSAFAASADGPYAAIVRSGMAALTSADSAGRASSPDVVAAAIARAVRARRPKTRYAVGSGARPILLARRLLSDRMFDRLVARIFLARADSPTAVPAH